MLRSSSFALLMLMAADADASSQRQARYQAEMQARQQAPDRIRPEWLVGRECEPCKFPARLWRGLPYEDLRVIFNALSAVYADDHILEAGYLANRAYELMQAKEPQRRNAQLLTE